ncbi:MAG: hypothetical protein IH598_16910 [Bacteroidales bacterium]|nr:hypothetical protein [Bacteroidales bacterium]
MSKKLTAVFLIFMLNFAVLAQESLYDYIKPGEFCVGFADTTLFDKTYRFEAYGYKGMKPYFVQIWHPLAAKPKDAHLMRFQDFFTIKKTEELKSIKEQLEKNNQEIFIRDFVAENLETGEPGSYGDYSRENIFGLIGKMKTKSSLQPFSATSDFPVIIYHHGSQSNSFENFAMAEYFASRGFIFIAANFHLPYEHTIFGLKPFDQLIKGEEEESLKAMVSFARSLSHSTSIFFIGHSWGAQMGFRTFDQDTTIKGFVSLETTIEFKNDSVVIKDLWPEVYQKIVNQKAYYPFPVLLCAATGQEKPFDFFTQLNAPHIIYAPTEAQFEHNAYLSMFYLRLFLDESIPQADKAMLIERLVLYVKHLETIEEYFNQIMNNEYGFGKEVRSINNHY